MKKADRITAIVLLVAAGGICWNSLQWPLMEEFGPGHGFMPFWLGVLLGVLAIVLLVQAARIPAEEDEPTRFPAWQGAKAVLLAILAMGVNALLLENIGFILSTLILVPFMMAVVLREKWKLTVYTTLGVTALLYVVFQVLLNINLPKSPLGI